MKTKTVNIAFRESLLRDIDRVARSESRSRSELVREAAREYIGRRDRWRSLFATGREIAQQQGLQPADIAHEIRAFRDRSVKA